MKLLPEDKKRSIAAVALLVLVVGATIYVYQKSFGPKTAAPGGAGGVTAPAQQQAQGPLLPYGAKIDMKVLEEDKFKVLRPTPGVGVTPEELGKPDLFAR